MGWQDAPEVDDRPRWSSAPEVGVRASAPVATPSSQGRPLPANAGLANFGATVLGAPADVGATILNLGIAGAGVATGTTPELINKPVLGSQWIKDKLRSLGMPGLSPDNPRPESQLATKEYEFTSRGGFIPGGALPAAGSMVAEAIGGPQWSGVGALAPTAAITAYNAARAPSLQAQQAHNAVRDQTLAESRREGFVMPPSQTNPTFIGNRIESIGGRAALNEESQLRNAVKVDNLARKAIDLPEGTPLTPQHIAFKREEFAQGYRNVSDISPLAAKTLERLRQVRNDAQGQWVFYDRSADPKAQKEAIKLDKVAAQLEGALEKMAKNAGKPHLIDELRQARTNIAKTYDVERALNVADGHIDPRIIGRAVDRGRPLTGELLTIGKFAEAFPNAARAPANVPPPGVSATDIYAMAGFGMMGGALAGPAGTTAALLPLARPGVRNAVLSGPYQRTIGTPTYTPAVQPQGSLEALLQQLVIQNQAKQ